MPAAVVAVAGMAAGTAMATAVVGTITAASTFGTMMAYAAVSMGTSMVVTSVLGGVIGSDEQDQQQQDSPAVAAARGMLLNTSCTVDPLMVLYGVRRIGGTLAMPPAVSGADNTYLHIILAHCEGECDGFDAVYFDGTLSTDARFTGAFTLEHFVGTDAQAACANLIAALPEKWTSAHKLSGVAYTYARLTFDTNVWRGVPVITADIRGRKVYDPRSGLTAWSDNPALCLRDYLTNARYGRGIAEASIDDTTIIAAANYCDASITTPAGSQKRYTCNGLVDTSKNSIDNVRALLTCMRGMLVFSGGLHKLVLDKADTAAFAFTEDNITGAWNIALGNKRGRFNRVRANWTNPDNEWQPDIALAESAAYRVTDNALMLESKIDLPFTTDAYEAQMLAQRHMKQSRFGTIASFRATIAGLGCEVGDIVSITHSTPGWTAKAFRVVRIGLLSSDEVEVTAVEYDDSVYVAEPLTTLRVSVTTNLPDPFTVATPGTPDVAETLFDTTGSAGVKARATMSWAALSDVFVIDYLPEYRVAAGAWLVLPATGGLSAEINDIAPGNYEFRYRARNALGVRSGYSGTRAKEILGLTAPPSTVTAFSIIASNGVAIGAWALSPDLDVRIGGRIVLRWTPLTAGAVWENGIDVGEFNGDAAGGLLPMLTGTYLAKAKDSTGNWSAAAASFVLTAGNLTALPNSLTVTEHTAFTGTKSGVVADAGSLKLDGTTLIDSMATLIDSWGYIDSLGGVASAGTYDFASLMDFGSVVTRRITPTIQALAFDAGDLIDSRDMVDYWDSVDGGVINDATAQLLAAISTDAVSYGAWFPLPAGDVTCRAIKYRLALASAAPTHNIGISQLSVTANW